MKKNMGSIDITIRVLIAFIIIGFYFSNKITGTTATVLLTLSVIFLLTSIVGVCPLYSLIGISTRKKNSSVKSSEGKMNIEKIIHENLGTIIDVRTPEEFKREHVSGSINIPLSEIETRINEIKNLKQPLVLCCVSGNRSGQATGYLLRKGFDCYNGGAWQNLQNKNYTFQK